MQKRPTSVWVERFCLFWANAAVRHKPGKIMSFLLSFLQVLNWLGFEPALLLPVNTWRGRLAPLSHWYSFCCSSKVPSTEQRWLLQSRSHTSFITISGKTSEKRYAFDLAGCPRLWQDPVRRLRRWHEPPFQPSDSLAGQSSPAECDTVKKGEKKKKATSHTVANEIGEGVFSKARGALPGLRAHPPDRSARPWARLQLGSRRSRDMAHEVNLHSLQESERETILQVLYRDREIQNVEEERIR